MSAACQLCTGPLPVSRQPKRFCSAKCRGDFHEGCRKLGERMFDEGAVTIEQIRQARSAK